MILCHCASVSDRAIKMLIAAGAFSVAEITGRCGAGRCCASCREAIETVLSDARDDSGPQAATSDE